MGQKTQYLHDIRTSHEASGRQCVFGNYQTARGVPWRIFETNHPPHQLSGRDRITRTCPLQSTCNMRKVQEAYRTDPFLLPSLLDCRLRVARRQSIHHRCLSLSAQQDAFYMFSFSSGPSLPSPARAPCLESKCCEQPCTSSSCYPSPRIALANRAPRSFLF